MERYKLRAFESKVFKRISGLKREEIKKFINSKKIKCMEHGIAKNCIQNLVGNPEWKKSLGEAGKVILKWILNK
jgi:hypothetical protein